MSQLDHLRTFLEAYRSQSFSRTAEHLGLTQPAVSQHIQALEALTGKPLFVRRARGVEPTAAADDLARSVAPFLDGLEVKLASLRPSTRELAGTVHIAGPAELFYTGLAERLAPLVGEGITLRLHTGNKERIYALLDDGTADLAITASTPDERAYDFLPVATERLLPVVAPSLRAKFGSELTEKAFAEVALIAYDEQLPLIRVTWAAMFGSNPTLQAALTIADMRTVEALAVAGQGWTVLPDYLCRRALDANRLVSLLSPDRAPSNTFYLVWSKGSLRYARTIYVRDALQRASREVFSGGQ